MNDLVRNQTTDSSRLDETRIALVLGSGGFKGPAHIGVLERLRDLKIPIYAMLGCSVGSIVTGYHATLGLSVEELLENALVTNAFGVVTHALAMRFNGSTGRLLSRWAEPVRSRLRQLERGDFHRLCHGVKKVGFLMHDAMRGERIFAVTGNERGFSVAEAVRGSARTPILFPPLVKEVDGIERRLVDGALSAPTPVHDAISWPVSATHVIAVDLTTSRKRGPRSQLARWSLSLGERLIVLRPKPESFTVRRGERSYVYAWYQAGRRSVGPAVEERLNSWLGHPAIVPASKSKEESNLPLLAQVLE